MWSSILTIVGQALRVAAETIGFRREQAARVNTPEMQERERRRLEAEAHAQEGQKVKDRDEDAEAGIGA